MAAKVESPIFTLTPEARAAKRHFLFRQLFHTPPVITTEDVDLTGKTAIVTGGNSGIGLETARHFLDLGASVILAVRDEAKGKAAAEDLAHGRQLASGTLQVWTLDLSEYKSILVFAERAKSMDNLDIVILNAAVIKKEETFGPEGYEESFHTNYLATTLLLLLLLPILKEKRTPGSPGRISVVSSDWASWAEFDGSGPDLLLPRFKKSRQPWDAMNTYGIAKLFNQLFVSELVKHLSPSEIIIMHPDPAMNKSGLIREATGITRLVFNMVSALVAREPTIGARTLVHSVTTVGEVGQGQYLEDERIEPLAPALYKTEGQHLARKLYEETLDELSFANVRELISGKV